VNYAKEADTKLVIALGGGSVMDMAKLIKAFYPNPKQAAEIVRGERQVGSADIELVAVPTTAGSGSEATQFAVVYIDKDKYSVSDPSLLPNYVYLNGEFIWSNSEYQLAVAGHDALAQAIESYWSKNASDESRGYSLEAIRLLRQNLPELIEMKRSVAHGDVARQQTLQNMMTASNLAGKAINMTRTTAAHAFSYAFTSYHGLAHGHAVWLTLPRLFEIHSRELDEDAEMKILADQLGLSAGNECEALSKFSESLGLDLDMSHLLDLDLEQRTFLSKQVNMERLQNNPVELSQDHINTIFNL